jgi:hypothetical protein
MSSSSLHVYHQTPDNPRTQRLGSDDCLTSARHRVPTQTNPRPKNPKVIRRQLVRFKGRKRSFQLPTVGLVKPPTPDKLVKWPKGTVGPKKRRIMIHERNTNSQRPPTPAPRSTPACFPESPSAVLRFSNPLESRAEGSLLIKLLFNAGAFRLRSSRCVPACSALRW